MRILSVLFLAACTPLTPDATPVGVDQPDEEKAILGGTAVAGPEFNFQAAVFAQDGAYFCSGIVLDESWILTIAGCATTDSRIGVGAPNLSAMVQLPIDEVISGSNVDLVHVATGTLTDFGRPATLVDAASYEGLATPGRMAAITGWGKPELSTDTSDSMQRADVPVLDPSVCGNFLLDGEDDLFCAGYIGFEAADVCNDLGAPLSVEEGGDQLVLGMSHIEACGSATDPSLYVNLSAHTSFVLEHVPGAQVVSIQPTEDDHGDDIDDATPLTQLVDLTIDGELEHDDTDVFSFVVGSAQTLVIGTTSTIDTIGRLLDADGNVIGSDDDSGPDRNFEITAEVQPGTYYVQVQGWLGTQEGPYTLEIVGSQGLPQPEPEPEPEPEECTDEDAGEHATMETAIAAQDSNAYTVSSAGGWEWYRIQAPAGKLMQIDTWGTPSDFVVRDADGEFIDSVYNHSEMQAIWVLTTEATELFVNVQTPTAGADCVSGTLWVTELECNHTQDTFEAQEGTSTVADLAQQTLALSGESDNDTWQVGTVQPGQTVTLEVYADNNEDYFVNLDERDVFLGDLHAEVVNSLATKTVTWTNDRETPVDVDVYLAKLGSGSGCDVSYSMSATIQ